MNLLIKAVDLSYIQRVAAGGLIKRASDSKVLADIHDFDVVFIKATQSTTIADDQFANSYAMARKFGKKVVAYHYNDNRVDAAAQAAFLLKTAPGADAYALDVEGAYAFTDAQSAAFIAAIRAKGKKCGYYHSTSGFGGVASDFRWVADYTLTALQDGTPPIDWDAWQFSSEGGPDGAGLDLDYVKADGALAAILGITFVTQAQLDAANTATAAMAAARDEALAEVADLNAQLLTAVDTNSHLQQELLAAPSLERDRIAAAEAERIRSL